ncbi:MAG: valine--tRNA ligase [Sedimentisphaerales bacterium]|nr:valine--tRNA ligase [Sedimentisphaerales bacterium]
MDVEFSKAYEPKVVETEAAGIWLAGEHFAAKAASAGADSYAIVIPPPNVTAALHLGHALNNTLQDILIRFRRMQQYNTLWMPGTDHAGIATQTVVEKRILSEDGKRRTDFKRDQFVARIQQWKDEYEATIIGQLKAMGCSCDWDRTRFTMDEVCAKAVRENFFRLFRDGLIYRGKRLVNWDPATQTVLADDEVEHETVQGHFWYLQYPLEKPVEIDGDKIEYVTVATTRPETMLGDSAVAMNPSDPRAEALVGKMVRLPIVARLIPIIADEHVVLPNPDSEDEKAKFSTGFLKVTPAHDPDDWAIGERHDLPVINVMAPDGSISDKHGWEDAAEPEAQNLLGMDRFEAREAIVEWFRQEGLLEDVREYAHEVGHSYRSHVPIEPYLSDQWYIAVKKPIDLLAEKFGSGLIDGTDVPANSLAGLALKPLLDGKLKFIPERYAKTYQTWLENLRDWPISRQLWWGHRIPIWTKAGDSDIEPSENLHYVTLDSEEGKVTYACIGCDSEQLELRLQDEGWNRDPDVLDTWFSSALWPFSTMGWPDDTPELKTFYPGNVLCTAREIITLWVSRMVMMGQYCLGDIPFSDVYIHAMIQDGQGRKMSKSLGNGIDPLVAIDSHGADAMRFTLASMTTDTQDIRMPVEEMTLPDGRNVNTSPKFDIGRNFCNKLWNASRFAMMNLEGLDPADFDKGKLAIEDRWILSRLAETTAEVTESLDAFKFSEPMMSLYRFFWNDFCDWYLEWAKPRMQDRQQKPIAQNVLAFVLDQTLRLLHPFIPFITEGIFQRLNRIAPNRGLAGIAQAKAADALVVAQWPDFQFSLGQSSPSSTAAATNSATWQIAKIQDTIRSVRDIENKHNMTTIQTVSASTEVDCLRDVLNKNKNLICFSTGATDFTVGKDLKRPKNSAAAITEDLQIYVHDAIDPEAERQRLEKQRDKVQKAKAGTEAKLKNENFLNRAKPEVVAQAKEKLAELSKQLETIEKHLAELNG